MRGQLLYTSVPKHCALESYCIMLAADFADLVAAEALVAAAVLAAADLVGLAGCGGGLESVPSWRCQTELRFADQNGEV